MPNNRRKYAFDPQKVVDYWWSVKRSRALVCEHFGVNRRVVDDWMTDIKRLGYAPRIVVVQVIAKSREGFTWPIDFTLYPALLGLASPETEQPATPTKAVKTEKIETEPRDVLEARRDKGTITALKASLKAVETRAMAAEDQLADMAALYKARVEPAVWLAKPHIANTLSLTPMLFTSDYQVGEDVKPEEIDGINSFNKDVFVERYQLMIEKTIALAEHNTGATEFPGIVYLRGGDAISGEIHEELAQTNDLSAIPACRLVFEQEREGIRRLRDKFGRVRVISLPGNHGRTTFKSHSKGYALRNFETLLSWWLATSFESDPNVRFWTPTSVDALFDVEGWKVLMSHGDKMGARGGTGFIGPAATIAKGHFKLYQSWTRTGGKVDMVLTGHLHTELKLEYGYANGSLAGFNEYARDLRCTPAAARQWLFFMHRKEMVSHAFSLRLSDEPKRSVMDLSADL